MPRHKGKEKISQFMERQELGDDAKGTYVKGASIETSLDNEVKMDRWHDGTHLRFRPPSGSVRSQKVDSVEYKKGDTIVRVYAFKRTKSRNSFTRVSPSVL